jgi:uncharacterized protein YukE
MARIRVDTQELRAKAKDFESAAESIAKAGDDILTTAMSLPSYDGQLSGPARAAGYEIQRQSREVQMALSGDAQSLNNSAQAFEAVDNQIVSAIGESSAQISVAPLLMKGGPGGENYAPVLNTNLDKLNLMISISHPGDVLRVRMPNGDVVTFIITHDSEGNLILWNMNEGRAWDGDDTIFFLSYTATDVALYHMDPKGGLELDQTPGARIGDDTKVPDTYEPEYYAQVGMLQGSDDLSTAASPSYDNGYLFYEKQYDPADLPLIAGKAITQGVAIFKALLAGTAASGAGAPIIGPLAAAAGTGFWLFNTYGEFCNWLHTDFSITDVEYHEGINPPYSPINQPYP